MKQVVRITALFMALAFLSGCSVAPAVTAAPPSATPSSAAAASPSPSPTVSAAPTAPPTPSPTPTAEPQLGFVFDPYVLPGIARAYLSDADYEQYKCFVDAVTAREPSVLFSEKAAVSKVISCFYSAFPLSILITDYSVDKKGLTVTLSYRFEAEEHSKRIDEFTARVGDVIRANVKPGYNRFEQILSLYAFTAQSIVYKDSGDVTPYNALMNGEGICQSYDGVLRFLLLQLGIDGVDANAFMTNGDAHVWTMVQLDGAWFHLDPTFESTANGGTSLQYFGMTDARRVDTGIVMPIGTGVDSWFQRGAPECADERLSVFDGVTRWEMDSGTHRLTLYYLEGEPCVVFDTENLEVCK